MTETEIRLRFMLAAKDLKGGYAELSRRTGIPRSHFYKILNQGVNPSFESMRKIADALGFELALVEKK